MKTYIMGDVHGHLDKLIAILQGAHLLDVKGAWSGEDTQLWFIGDLVDRGPDGVGVIELVMRLQRQAVATGGSVQCLLGNHEINMLAAQRFGRQDSYFVTAWRRNGGQDSDMARLTPQHIGWIQDLPAMARVGDRLLMHADSAVYLSHAPTIDGVNSSIRDILYGTNMRVWEELIEDFSQHRTFISIKNGEAYARDYLRLYGGKQIIHGHTSIQVVADVITPTKPFVYLDGRVVNVDGGMAMGAAGFIWQIE